MKVILRLQTNTIVAEVPLEVNTSIVIGRSSKSNHKVLDELMSSTHCKLMLTPRKLEITDLESKNGTYLNGLRIEQSEVFLGDEIKIGGTKVTILQDKMDPATIQAITFPGAAKDRQSHGLQLDFTGARMINQGLVTPPGMETRPTTSANRELEVRKKVQSKIKLSKQEIKLRNKKRASLASTLDVISVFASIALPLIITNLLVLLTPNLMQHNRLIIMFGSVVISMGFFYVLNFKTMKFTVGEKLAGIESLYNDQESKD